MVTPFDEKGEVDYKQAARLAKALVASGSDGVVIAGTTGESPTLSWEEEEKLFHEVKAALAGKGSLVAGTGSNSTSEAIQATKDAEKIGVDAALLVVPYYNKPSQEGLYQHFKAIATNTKLPCILYNVPARTITSLAPETIIKLSQIENIIGIKEASGDLGQVAKILNGVTRKDFKVWSGNDADTFPIMSMGGYGIVSVASHLVGKQIKAMMNATLAGNMAEAAAMHLKLMPMATGLFILSNPVPVKYAVNHIGFNVGKPRLPLVEPDEKSAAQIRELVKGYKIDLPLK